MKRILIIVTLAFAICDFSLAIERGSKPLPKWINRSHEPGLYLGIGAPAADEATSRGEAIILALATYAFQQPSDSLKGMVNLSLESENSTGNSSFEEVIELHVKGFDLDVEDEYINPNGEYFVLCRISKSDNTANELRGVRGLKAPNASKLEKGELEMVALVDLNLYEISFDANLLAAESKYFSRQLQNVMLTTPLLVDRYSIEDVYNSSSNSKNDESSLYYFASLFGDGLVMPFKIEATTKKSKHLNFKIKNVETNFSKYTETLPIKLDEFDDVAQPIRTIYAVYFTLIEWKEKSATHKPDARIVTDDAQEGSTETIYNKSSGEVNNFTIDWRKRLRLLFAPTTSWQ